VVAIKNVHPLERSTEKLLPAPDAVPAESKVFLSSVRRLIFIYILCLFTVKVERLYLLVLHPYSR
jgi:hypothetical protein